MEDDAIDGFEALEEPVPYGTDMPAEVTAGGVSASTQAGSRSDGDLSASDGRSGGIDGIDHDGDSDDGNGTGTDSRSESKGSDGDPDVNSAGSSDPVDRTSSVAATEPHSSNDVQQQSFTGRRNPSVIRRLLRRDR